jgi:hypothetical protein
VAANVARALSSAARLELRTFKGLEIGYVVRLDGAGAGPPTIYLLPDPCAAESQVPSIAVGDGTGQPHLAHR